MYTWLLLRFARLQQRHAGRPLISRHVEPSAHVLRDRHLAPSALSWPEARLTSALGRVRPLWCLRRLHARL